MTESKDLAQGVEDGHIKRAWKRFSDEFFRGPDAPYPGMIEAFEKHYGQSWGDREWRDEARTWAAAWKAAVHHAEIQPRKPGIARKENGNEQGQN